jgi:hypothetical protein
MERDRERHIGGENEGKRQRGTDIGKEKQRNRQERREREEGGG